MRSDNARDEQRDRRNGTGSEDGLAKAIEIVVTPAIFAAAGFGLDRWWDTGPWLALSFGVVAFIVKLLVEWYRYAERMQLHEEELASNRPSKQRGIDRATGFDEPTSLPTGVSLESDTDSTPPQP
ncbi:AtpZ/AtpI family protein [Candidatus Poriferisodalis sp.]|uniref:AtpZ/AtpI family protein n=1 Tax=Candidatus Poriferisodalis sp. TaxID=3101277 RepID=UPI003C6ED407